MRRSTRSPRPSCARARRRSRKSTPACAKRLRPAPSALLLRRLDDGVVAVGVEADQIPRLAHVRRQRRRDVDGSAARMRHDDAARHEMQAVLHAPRQLPVLLRKIFWMPHGGVADMGHVRAQLVGAAGHRLEREPGQWGGCDNHLSRWRRNAAKLTFHPHCPMGAGRSQWMVGPASHAWSRAGWIRGLIVKQENSDSMSNISSPLKPAPSWAFLAVIRTIDKFTDWTGHLFVLLIIPLIFANVIEVFARYVLKSPTIWALDVTTMSYGALFMLGPALALVKCAQVRTDMVWEKFSDRTNGMIDSRAYLLLFLPTMAVLFFISSDDLLYSLSIDQRARSGAWTPILWPLRGVIPLTAFMLFVQGISELMKSLWAWRTGEFLTQHEKIEV